MSENILGLYTVGYMVGDLDVAKKWYAELFETEPYFDEPFYVGFNIRGWELGLQPSESKEKTTAENVFNYWGVKDIRKMKEKLLGMGAEIHEDITNVGGPLEVMSVRDPWGNVVGFIYNPEFKLP